jgi:hypothetical protein
VPEEVLKARPEAKGGTPAKGVLAKPAYRPATGGAATLSRPAGGRQVGVTIWRLRPAVAADSGARILIQEGAGTSELVPERVPSSSSLKTGDRVRLSIESPDTGYLYVIDRERYASGERGQPWLIFPTTRTRGGDNKASGGRLIDIPAQDDRPNFFTLRPGRNDEAEEELTVLLTKAPLEGITPGNAAQQLTTEQVAKWEKLWGTAGVESFELNGGAGKTWTVAEQQAGSATRVLTQDDPPPQTVYRVAVKPEDPLMVKVHLRYGR